MGRASSSLLTLPCTWAQVAVGFLWVWATEAVLQKWAGVGKQSEAWRGQRAVFEWRSCCPNLDSGSVERRPGRICAGLAMVQRKNGACLTRNSVPLTSRDSILLEKGAAASRIWDGGESELLCSGVGGGV